MVTTKKYSITIKYQKLKTKTETTEWMNYKLNLSVRYSNYEILIDMHIRVKYRSFFNSRRVPQQKDQIAACGSVAAVCRPLE